MGASQSHLVSWFAAAGLRLVALGVAAGSLAGWVLAGALEGLLFGLPPKDLTTLAIAATLLTAVGLAAALVPSWRATRVNPVTILRRG